jgi:hypothetical protein
MARKEAPWDSYQVPVSLIYLNRLSDPPNEPFDQLATRTRPRRTCWNGASVGEASTIGVSKFECCGDRLRASTPPVRRAPAKIARNIGGERRAMKQPLIEGDAIACERAIDRWIVS